MPTWFDALADLLWGSCCPVCGEGAAGLCPQCVPRAVPRVHAVGPWVSMPVMDQLADAPSLAGGRYDDPIGAIIRAVKDGGRHDLMAVLECHAAAAAARLPRAPRPVRVVPVPSRPSTVRRRGIDVTHRLARAVARRVDGRAERVLRHSRPVRDQVGLSSLDRAINLRDAISVRGPLPRGTSVILVDDVLTTGATLQACAQALHRAGARLHGAVVVAVTPPPGVARRDRTVAS